MPVLAVAGAAIGLAAGGATAIGAVVAGTATLATTLTAVAAVGATVGAVGAVTGNKTLETAGLILGGVGGVGALAANAGLLGDSATTDSLFGGSDAGSAITAPNIASDAAASTNDLSGLANTPDISGDLSDGTAVAGNGGAISSNIGVGGVSPEIAAAGINSQTNIVDALGGNNLTPDLPNSQIDQALAAQTGQTTAANAQPAVSTTNPSNANVALPGTPGTATGPQPTPQGAQQASASSMGGDVASGLTPSQAANTTNGSALGLPQGNYIGQNATAPDGTSVTWNGTNWTKQSSGFLSWVQNNQLASWGLLQAGGGLANGLFSPVTPAEVALYSAQAANNKAAAALTTQQLSNIQGSTPTASRQTTPTTPAVTGQPLGLLNNAPVNAPVTGQLAA